MWTTIIIFFAVLSAIVFAHELGHFWTARKFGIKVEEFGFGLPPRIFGWQVLTGEKASGQKGRLKFIWGHGAPAEENKVVYSLNWLPIGGFVKIKGEEGEATNDPDSFAAKAIWRRILVLSAGVMMNVLLCVALLSFGFFWGVPAEIGSVDAGAKVSQSRIQIVEVIKDTAASQAGLIPGDVIISVDGQTFTAIDDLRHYLIGRKDQNVNLLLFRGSEKLSLDLPVKQYDDFVGLGVSLAQTAIVRYPWYLALWRGLLVTGSLLMMIISAFAGILINLLQGAPAGVEVSGPVGIAVLTGQAAKLGFGYILEFTALLSLNLAIINFLPFPALDGGRVLFLLIEKIRGRAIKRQWENLAHNVGFLLLLLLIFVVTYRDLLKYGGQIFSAVKGLVGL